MLPITISGDYNQALLITDCSNSTITYESNISNELTNRINEISSQILNIQNDFQETVNIKHHERLIVLEKLVQDGPPIWSNEITTNNTIDVSSASTEIELQNALLPNINWEESSSLTVSYDTSYTNLVEDSYGRFFADLQGIKSITYSHTVYDACVNIITTGDFSLNIHVLDWQDNSINYTQKIAVH